MGSISSITEDNYSIYILADNGIFTIDKSSELQIDMNIAEWFKNPNEWNLNDLHSMLMPNFDAQVMMYENGKDVFKLKSD